MFYHTIVDVPRQGIVLSIFNLGKVLTVLVNDVSGGYAYEPCFLYPIFAFANGDSVYQFRDRLSGQCQDAKGMVHETALVDMRKSVIHHVQFIGGIHEAIGHCNS